MKQLRAPGVLWGLALMLWQVGPGARAMDPVTVGIALAGTASALTGLISLPRLYCYFAECCVERPVAQVGKGG